jgi:DNA-binding winged helix-turn-helix (wHTH) protein
MFFAKQLVRTGHSLMKIIKKIYLEGKVVYEPETHSLYRMEDKENQVTLAIPASLCLFALLQNKGNLVSHHDLLTFAWVSRGMNVSPNTVYQNMSLLRKSLESLGLPGNMIKTVPKRGFVIPESFPVEFTDEHPKIDAASEEEMPDIENSAPSALPLSLKENKRAQVINKIVFPITCVIVFYFTYLISNYVGEDTIPDYIAPEYVRITSPGDCNIFRNRSLREDGFFKSFINDNKLQCGREKWWYITNYPPSLEISLFRCSDDLSKNTDQQTSLCTSDFYDGIENEK